MLEKLKDILSKTIGMENSEINKDSDLKADIKSNITNDIVKLIVTKLFTSVKAFFIFFISFKKEESFCSLLLQS